MKLLKNSIPLILLALIFSPQLVFGQDLIVLKSKDSIHCKVLKSDDAQFVEIATNKNDSISLSKIKVADIDIIEKNFFASKVKPLTACNDTIIAKDGDTIICKILLDKQDWYINYELPNKSKQNIGYASIQKLVKCANNNSSKENVFTPKEETKTQQEIIDNLMVNKKFRIGVQAQLVYRIFILPDGLNRIQKDHYNQIRINYGALGEMHWAIDKKKEAFLGGNISYLTATAITPDVILTPQVGTSGISYIGDFKTDINILYIGPSLVVKIPNKKSTIHQYSLKIGIDLIFYDQSESISNFYYKINGVGAGFSTHFLYDYKLDKNISLGLNLGFDTGNIREVEINDNGKITNETLPENEAIGLLRLTAAGGLRFWF